MNIPLGPLLGLDRIFDAREKDRGVLGSIDSRMESEKRSENSLNSSQGKTKPGPETVTGLSECKMHRITESSSIRFLIYTLIFLSAMAFLSVRSHAARSMPTREQIEAQYDQVGTGFEAMMLNNLYSQMRASSELVKMGDDNPFAPSNAEKIFRSMREQEMIESLAKTGPLGVKKMVVDRLKGRGGIEQGRVIE
ncbi:MAG TPA: rod-binding protein [Bdellovibrionota bacterium]|nr:rod-binding protein [Bdellovibrionota bacterium]